MKRFEQAVAVVTGGASGIGFAMAKRFAKEGMRVVVADIGLEALRTAERELHQAGATVLAVQTDVSKQEDVDGLALEAFAKFGAVHILCNNAGVAVGGPLWEHALQDWQWVLGVNLWGVIHGVRAFVPRMLAQDTEGHIVNTGSLAGLVSFPNAGVYGASKAAVIALSETLHHDLRAKGSKLRVSVLCPAAVATRIADSERNRPRELSLGQPTPEAEEMARINREAMAAGIPPDKVADRVFEAIRDEKFYVLTHGDEARAAVKARFAAILEERAPSFDLDL
jgi:NADP-dependent 3-hydroxy acid dehydrogenase YdfG